MPYIITLVALGYEPEEWFKDRREMTTMGEWDYYTRYGKMYFMYNNILPGMEGFIEKTLSTEHYRPGRILLIIRPGEIQPENYLPEIIHRVIRPDGEETLWLCKI
jgi:hypothetical protein